MWTGVEAEPVGIPPKTADEHALQEGHVALEELSKGGPKRTAITKKLKKKSRKEDVKAKSEALLSKKDHEKQMRAMKENMEAEYERENERRMNAAEEAMQRRMMDQWRSDAEDSLAKERQRMKDEMESQMNLWKEKMAISLSREADQRLREEVERQRKQSMQGGDGSEPAQHGTPNPTTPAVQGSGEHGNNFKDDLPTAVNATPNEAVERGNKKEDPPQQSPPAAESSGEPVPGDEGTPKQTPATVPKEDPPHKSPPAADSSGEPVPGDEGTPKHTVAKEDPPQKSPPTPAPGDQGTPKQDTPKEAASAIVETQDAQDVKEGGNVSAAGQGDSVEPTLVDPLEPADLSVEELDVAMKKAGVEEEAAKIRSGSTDDLKDTQPVELHRVCTNGDLESLLNRASTGELAEGTPQSSRSRSVGTVLEEPRPKELEIEPEDGKIKKHKERNKSAHARRERFYRSLASVNSPPEVRFMAEKARQGSRAEKTSKLQTLFEQWCSASEQWSRSQFVLRMRNTVSSKHRGARRWMPKKDIVQRYGEDVAQQIISEKLKPEFEDVQWKRHPDVPHLEHMYLFKCWDEEVEAEEKDEVIESLFEGFDTDKKRKKSSSGQKAEKKRKKTSSSSRSSPSSSSESSWSAAKKRKRHKKERKEKKENKKDSKKEKKRRKSASSASASDSEGTKAAKAKLEKKKRDDEERAKKKEEDKRAREEEKSKKKEDKRKKDEEKARKKEQEAGERKALQEKKAKANKARLE